MSTEPPPPPPPPPPIAPPPGPPYGTPTVIPWEERERYGFLTALLETVKLFVTSPAEAWRRTPEKGSMVDPLLFSIFVSWIGAVFSAIWGLFFTVPWLRMMPAEMRDRLGPSLAGSAGMTVAQMILAPIFVVIALFIASALFHLCLMVVGGLSGSTAGFDGTFRTLAYSAVADLANVVPFVGGLIAFVWKIILVVMGFVALHKTTQGKAIAAVLIPLVVCCGCAILGASLVVGAVLSMMNR
jgi:hypothetical protein